MRKFTKPVLLGAMLIAAATAMPSLYARAAPMPAQSQSGSQSPSGSMGNQGMMGGGDGNQQGMMGGGMNGMMGMMSMMSEMNKMMETCNTMMQRHMDNHGGGQPNGQNPAPATPDKG